MDRIMYGHRYGKTQFLPVQPASVFSSPFILQSPHFLIPSFSYPLIFLSPHFPIPLFSYQVLTGDYLNL